jgi:RimJ/RimL family protein N-acetyltransferase
MIIEDSFNGTLAAKEAGVPCIGFINPNSGNQDLSNASVLIESFKNVDYQFLSDELKRANGEPVTIASTKRLIIRELTVSDIKDMYQIYQNEEVVRFVDDLNDYLDVEMEKHKAYIKNIYGFYGYGLWGVYSKTTKALIGRAGIQNQMIDGKEEVELSYLFDVNHWGYGYAFECITAILSYAVNILEIPRIVAVIDELNTRSIKVAERIGMKCEKEIMHKDRQCYLYSISLTPESKDEDEKRIAATAKVIEEFTIQPDKQVYSKRFQHKKKEQ